MAKAQGGGTYVHTYIHTYINPYIHTYINPYIHTLDGNIYLYLHVYVHVSMKWLVDNVQSPILFLCFFGFDLTYMPFY